MQICAWHVITWDTMRMTLEEWEDVSRKMLHASISFHVGEHTSRATSMGQVVWAADLGSGKVGVAWDWAEIGSKYVVMLDPMSFLCNVSLVDSSGMAIDEGAKVVLVNDCIHSLPWQEQVLKARRHMTGAEQC